MSLYAHFVPRGLIEYAAQGMTISEVAALTGANYSSVWNAARKYGVTFQRRQHKAKTAAPLQPRTSPNAERNQQIVARFDAGETLESISLDYGITRERVRQIVDKAGRQSRRELKIGQFAEMADRLRGEWHTVKSAAELLGVSRQVARDVARKHHINLHAMEREEHDAFMAMVARVEAGESIYAISGGDRSTEVRLRYFCNKIGVKSKARSRHMDFSHRTPLLREWRASGLDWKECAGRLATIEGRNMGAGSICAWAYRNIPDLPSQPRKQREPRLPKVVIREPRVPKEHKVVAPRKPRPIPNVDILPTVKETALANRDNATAAQIAAACGVSRNSIIGYWWRAKQSGELEAAE